jgi:branched-chain amino acid transport system ATP-binding protein
MSNPTPDPGTRTTTATPALALRDVRAGYGGIEALHGVTIEVPAGSVVALLGPNGAGKTTAINVACGLVTPTDGTVEIAGREVTGTSATDIALSRVCTIPEGRGVFPNLTVRENLRMATYTGQSRADIEERAFARFPRLSERCDQLAGTLSGGEQQMLALARGLATEPEVLMLDELSMGLAPIIVGQLYEQVAAIAATGVSILVVEQFARSVLGVADLAVVLTHGIVRHAGPAAELDDALLASAYLGGP